MSRKNRDEEHFGSDSFLDVLANIVGILIILIVSAAARVERGPVSPPPSAAAEEPVSESSEPVYAPPGATASEPEVEIARTESRPDPEPLPELEPDAPPPEISDELRAIQKNLSSLDTKSRELTTHLDRRRAEADSAVQLLSAEEKAAEKRTGKLRQSKV